MLERVALRADYERFLDCLRAPLKEKRKKKSSKKRCFLRAPTPNRVPALNGDFFCSHLSPLYEVSGLITIEFNFFLSGCIQPVHVKKCRENIQQTRGFIEQFSRWEKKMFGPGCSKTG